MRPVSLAFLDTIRGSHTMTARATVVAAGQNGVTPIGTRIPIIDGKVDEDGTAAVRGSLDMTTDGTGQWPARSKDLLAPYGNEVFVERGVDLGGGVTEWCSLGYFRIDTAGQDNPPDGPIRMAARDRMQGVIDARLLTPVQFTSPRTYGGVVNQLIKQVYPSAVIEWDDSTSSATLGRDLITEEKRFEFIDDLVTSRGKIWYWDHRGVLVIRTPPTPYVPVWDVDAGANGVLVSLSRQLSRDGVFNAVVASGEAAGTDTPVRAVAVNSDKSSPTYYYGPFGPVPEFYSSPFLLRPDQAAQAAVALLTKKLGLPYNVDFTAIPNPALEPYDPVRLIYSNKVGSEVHVLQKITVPLTETGTLTASTREQTRILIGQGRE